MRCPRCETELRERTRAGVVVDACDRCRGMWLDRGELEKLVAELHAYEEERAVRHPVSPGDGVRQASRRRGSTWSRLMQLFDPAH